MIRQTAEAKPRKDRAFRLNATSRAARTRCNSGSTVAPCGRESTSRRVGSRGEWFERTGVVRVGPRFYPPRLVRAAPAAWSGVVRLGGTSRCPEAGRSSSRTYLSPLSSVLVDWISARLKHAPSSAADQFAAVTGGAL